MGRKTQLALITNRPADIIPESAQGELNEAYTFTNPSTPL